MNNSPNAQQQYRVLYRQFLFRVVDLEVLSARALGDSNKLLGQFAALLIVISLLVCGGAFGIIDANNMPPDARLAFGLFMAHFLVATTMLIVGIFAVLSWDSIFPDRRDVFVLAPLPLRARTMFLAKLAATAIALSLVVVFLNCATGLTYPFALAVAETGALGVLRSFAAYWFTMFAAGIFIYCALLAIQGFAAQILPRRLFLRVSGFLQMTAFCSFVCAYFLEPPVDSLKMLTAPQNHHALLWLPSYWFLGLFQQLNGSMHAALVPLARRAWVGMAAAAVAAIGAYALSYVRTMRQIVEQPDITPTLRGLRWLPRFGDREQTAIGQFCVRTLARSRQHRLIFAFYLGVGLALTIFLLQFLATGPQNHGAPAINSWHQANVPLLVSTIMMMVLAVLGARVVFAFPLELQANWIFRAVATCGPSKAFVATRRALLLLSALPVWIVSAIACLWLWPWTQAIAHLMVLGLLGMILVDLALWDFRKVPFACSYLPGKSHVHMVVIAVVVLIMLVAQSVTIEQQSLQKPALMAVMLVLLALAAVAIRWRVTSSARLDQEELRFEETDPSDLVELGLSRHRP
jgi:hypothetical protein